MKIIAHIDMDAFFAAVEERERPWLKGLPIAIGSDPKGGEGRGVVSTANYMAREYGIRSALPISKAWKFSEKAKSEGKPGVAFLVPSMGQYSESSKVVFDIVANYSSKMQITSIDEAYFDLSHLKSFKKAEEVCEEIKQNVKKKTKLTCSVGIAPNKMIAKIASDFQKPNGLTVVKECDVTNFLAPLSVRKIPGVGPKTELELKRNGIEIVADALKFSWKELSDLLGSYGFDLYQKIRGVGDTELTKESIRKSIGHHQTFLDDVDDMEYIFNVLQKMSQKIFATMKVKKFKEFRTIVLTVRFSDFETKTRSLTVDDSVTSAQTLYILSMKLALPFFDTSENPGNKKIRMVGLRVEKLI